MSLYEGATNMLDWTVTGSPGYDLAWIGPNNDLGLTAANGSYFLDLTGYHNSPPWDGVSQTVPTTVGHVYFVSYEIGYNSGYDGSTMPAVSVAVTGSPTITNTFVPGGTNVWETFSFSFTASATNTTLTFAGATPQGLAYIGLDNVIMWAAESSSPVIVMGTPVVAHNEVTLPFTVTNSSASTFQLLQESQLTGPWSTNSSAVLTTVVPDSSYYFTVPTSGASEFYRVESP
jgi:hypothetical protein